MPNFLLYSESFAVVSNGWREFLVILHLMKHKCRLSTRWAGLNLCNGTTLIETLVALTIFSLIVVGLSSSSRAIYKSFQEKAEINTVRSLRRTLLKNWSSGVSEKFSVDGDISPANARVFSPLVMSPFALPVRKSSCRITGSLRGRLFIRCGVNK